MNLLVWCFIYTCDLLDTPGSVYTIKVSQQFSTVHILCLVGHVRTPCMTMLAQYQDMGGYCWSDCVLTTKYTCVCVFLCVWGVDVRTGSRESSDLSKHLKTIPFPRPDGGSCYFPPSHTNTLCNPYGSPHVSAARIAISDKQAHNPGVCIRRRLVRWLMK